MTMTKNNTNSGLLKSSLILSLMLPLGLASFALVEAKADYVSGLNPNGDNFLTLRQYASSRSRAIGRMGPNTIVEVLDADGPWFYVETEDGRIGWAHSKWIYPGLPPSQRSNTYRDEPLAPAPASSSQSVPALPAYEDPPRHTEAANNTPPPTPEIEIGEFDWLDGHMSQYHDPLKYYPE